MKKILPVIFAIIGLLDAGYLTYERFAKLIVPCSTGYFVDCGKVLDSPYATPFGVPLSLIGVIHYTIFLIGALLVIKYKSDVLKRILFVITAAGAVASLYFVYLQIFVIGAICMYCMVSAINSFVAYLVIRTLYKHEFRNWIIWVLSFLYANVLKRIFFSIHPELVHTMMTKQGEMLGRITLLRKLFALVLSSKKKVLSQTLHGIHFSSPLGLAAGFDYEARLTQIVPAIGFGFQSVGTITNLPHAGNSKPMLGRLPKSKSLMVNKGFKNDGAEAVIKKLRKQVFGIPVGISIGQTNGLKTNKLEDVINDLIAAFNAFEKSQVKHSYYELNISCPNLSSTVSFYNTGNLEKLLKAVDSLKIKKPIFIKMPIEKSNEEFMNMMAVIIKHSIHGIIVGNLQKNKKDPAFNKNEIKKWPNGGFSGKPTEQRSNELISLAYQKYGKKLTIVGCGGVFNAQDAYEKMKRGASLIQLITGMIYQGPQLIAQINEELPKLLQKDGFANIKEALGSHRD